MHSRWFLTLALVLCAAPVFAQDAAPPSRLEIETLTLYSRYRFLENNADVVTANQMQMKDSLRARFNLDESRRLSIHVGAFTGSSFTSSWDTTGIGTGAWSPDAYVKQLYLAAVPVKGVELQVGGLYFDRGESTEITTYDEDGYVMGERMVVRRPAQVYFDELSVTRGGIGSSTTPGVFRRLDLFANPDYWQVQAIKRFSKTVSASADVSSAFGARTVRAAVAIHLPEGSPASAVRVEAYSRTNANAASGFAVVAERPVGRRVRLQAGYATIDEFYGGLNADRIQRGPRVFAIANVPLPAALSVQFFITRAFEAAYPVSNKTRFDAVISYDLLAAIRGAARR